MNEERRAESRLGRIGRKVRTLFQIAMLTAAVSYASPRDTLTNQVVPAEILDSPSIERVINTGRPALLDPALTQNASVRSLAESPRGGLWVGYETEVPSGASYVDLRDPNNITVTHQGFVRGRINSILEHEELQVAFFAADRFDRDQTQRFGVYSLDLTTGEWKQYLPGQGLPVELDNQEQAYALARTPRGVLLGTAGGGAEYENGQWNLLKGVPPLVGRRAIHALHDNPRLIGQRDSGLYLETDTDSASYTAFTSDFRMLPSNKIRSIALLSDGDFLIGSDPGLSRLSPKSRTLNVEEGLPNAATKMTLGIATAPSGLIGIAREDGGWIKKGNNWTQFIRKSAKAVALTEIDGAQWAFFGTQRGLVFRKVS